MVVSTFFGLGGIIGFTEEGFGGTGGGGDFAPTAVGFVVTVVVAPGNACELMAIFSS